MVDSKYSSDKYKSQKIRIGAILKNPKILNIVPDHFKSKTMSKHTVKTLPFVIRFVPD